MSQQRVILRQKKQIAQESLSRARRCLSEALIPRSYKELYTKYLNYCISQRQTGGTILTKTSNILQFSDFYKKDLIKVTRHDFIDYDVYQREKPTKRKHGHLLTL